MLGVGAAAQMANGKCQGFIQVVNCQSPWTSLCDIVVSERGQQQMKRRSKTKIARFAVRDREYKTVVSPFCKCDINCCS